MNRTEAMAALAACRALEAVLVEALGNEAQLELAEHGTAMTARVRHDDGTDLMTLSTNMHRPWVSVHDEAAWQKWVTARHPEEIETLVRVRPSWQSMYLKAVAKRGSPPQAKDGEAIPGLSWHPGGGFSHVALVVAESVKARLDGRAREMVSGSRPLALPEVGE